jgi:Na+/H+-dicarboxylate symporter
VPLVFVGIAASIAQAGSARRLGRILGAAFLVFAATSLAASTLGLTAALVLKPVEGVDFRTLQAAVGGGDAKQAAAGLLETLVAAGSVPDFTALLSRKNMLALVVFAILAGLSTALAGERGRAFAAWLDSGARSRRGSST